MTPDSRVYPVRLADGKTSRHKAHPDESTMLGIERSAVKERHHG